MALLILISPIRYFCFKYVRYYLLEDPESPSIYQLLAADHLGIQQIISAQICKNDCHALIQTDYDNNIGELKIEISFEIRGLGCLLGQKLSLFGFVQICLRGPSRIKMIK